jgi:hypothetical protein
MTLNQKVRVRESRWKQKGQKRQKKYGFAFFALFAPFASNL